MFRDFQKSSRTALETYKDKHRFEHWYVDNQVYFITGTCRDHCRAFATEEAKEIFWDRFEHWARVYDFDPWIVSLLDTHYHFIGYNTTALKLKTFMQRFHGSVAKLVNDTLPERRRDFFRDKKGKEYFDGCLRDEKQYRLAFRYTHMQARRHGIMHDYMTYSHTRIYIPLEVGLERALELNAFMIKVPYKRYEK